MIIRISFLFILCCLFISCKTETGKDIHPEVLFFPKTTNPKIKIEPFLYDYEMLRYNDSLLIFKKEGKVSFYAPLIDQLTVWKTNVKHIGYANGLFILEYEKGVHEIIKDKTFERYKINVVDDTSYYKRIKDSINNEPYIGGVLDSIYLHFFLKKYAIDLNDTLPYTSGTRNLSYIKTKSKEFIYVETPSIILRKLNPGYTFYGWIKPNNKPVYSNDDITFKDTIVKFFDYALLEKKFDFYGSGKIFLPGVRTKGLRYYQGTFKNESFKFKGYSQTLGCIKTIAQTDNHIILKANDTIYKLHIK